MSPDSAEPPCTPPRLILFDLDGTLIDSLKDIQKCVNRLRALHDLEPVDRATVQGGIGHGARELVRKTVPELIDSEGALDDRYTELLTFYETHAVNETEMYPGAEAFLRRVHPDTQLGILSNKPLGITERILEHLGLTPLFEIVRCPENSRVRKPDPQAMHDVLDDLGRTASETWFIGDSCPDFATGHGAGVFTFGVRFGYYDGGDPEPHAWIDTFTELETIWETTRADRTD